ncbi:MAG: hypothetical protein HWE26_00725 [Alteromonadaceae bacterium]|nr:hypothetical protein [Alteromonadaceae bacterium]
MTEKTVKEGDNAGWQMESGPLQAPTPLFSGKLVLLSLTMFAETGMIYRFGHKET